MLNVLRSWTSAVMALLPLLRERRARLDAARAILRVTGVTLRVTLQLTWRTLRILFRLTPQGALGWLLLRRRQRR